MASDHSASTALSPERRRLLALMLEERGIAVQSDGAIRRRRAAEPVPLSLNQEGLWVLHQLFPGRVRYSIPGAVRLRGRLHVRALERSLSEIVRRHESLRTSVAIAADGAPVQAIAAADPLELSVTDLRAFPRAQREAEALRLATAEARRPFELTRGPLFRASLLHLDETDHVLLVNMHHIVADGWSMGVFTRELGTLYQVFSTGRPSPLADLPLQYADFAVWQRAWLQAETLATRLAYWRRHLRDRPPVLELPADRPRPSVPSFDGRHEPIQLSPSLTGALKALSGSEGVTLFMTMLAAFDVLLSVCTGDDDFVVGTGMANRDRSELEGLIGYFATVVPLRVSVQGDPRFRDVLHRVRQVTVEACAHHLPGVMLAKELHTIRDLSRNPLFQVEFTLLTPDHNPAVYGYGLSSTVGEMLALPGLTVSPLAVEGEEARFDLAVFVWDMPNGVGGTFEYSTDLFEASTIKRMVKDFETLLRLAVANPEARLSALCERLAEARQQETLTYRDGIRSKLKSIKRRPSSVRGR